MAVDQQSVARQLERAPSQLIDRARHLMGLFRSLPNGQALGLLVEHIVEGSGSATRTVQTKQLRFPFQLTAAHSDLAMFSSVIGNRAFDAPANLSAAIDGNPVIDVGANIGVATALFASRYPESRVLAIEPHCRNLSLLIPNARPYGSRVSVLPGALTSQSGAVELVNPSAADKGWYGSYRYDAAPSHTAADTNMAIGYTANEVDKMLGDHERIGLLKINIGGGERDLFASGSLGELLVKTNVLMVYPSDYFAPGAREVVHEASQAAGLQPFTRPSDHLIGYMA